MTRLSALCALLCATLVLSSTAAVADDPLADRGLLTGEISVDGHGGSSGVVMA